MFGEIDTVKAINNPSSSPLITKPMISNEIRFRRDIGIEVNMVGAMRPPPHGRNDQRPANALPPMVWGCCDIVQPPFIIDVTQDDITRDIAAAHGHKKVSLLICV